MPLRRRIYLLGGSALVVTMVAILLVSRLIVIPDLQSAAQSEARQEMLRAYNSVEQCVADLSSRSLAYHSSNDIAALVAADGSSSADPRLEASFFLLVRADVAALVDDDAGIVWGASFDASTKKTGSLPVGLAGQLSARSLLVKHKTASSDVSGILALPGGPLLIDSRPIVSKDGRSLSGATLITGRWLNDSLLAELAGPTLLGLELLQIPPDDPPAEAETASSLALRDHFVSLTPSGSDSVYGYLSMDDIFGATAVFLRVIMPPLDAGGITSAWWHFALGLMGVILVLAGVVAIALEGSLFRRLAGLTGEVRRARLNTGKFVPLPMHGKDELSELARAINGSFLCVDRIRSEQEKQAGSLVSTLRELEGRHRDLEKAHFDLQQLQQASVSLGGSLEIRDALAQLEAAALDIFQADELWLLRLHEDHRLEGLRAFSRRGNPSRLPRLFGCQDEQAWLPVKINRLLRTVLDGNPRFVDSVQRMEPSEQQQLFGGPPPELGGLRSLAVVPLLAESQPVGVAISASLSAIEFNESRKSTILLFASQVAQALKNALLYEEIKVLGEIDSLTGLYNRRKSLEQLEVEVERASRYQGTFSVLVADIDNFKLFNDTYGHPAGDVIIKRVAGVLQHGTRSSDLVGRYGGDEFILILPETYRSMAGVTADHLRAALGALPYVAPNGACIPLRMSFGAASFPYDGLDAASLIAVADANLYESKRWGGDTVTVERENFSNETPGSRGFTTLDALVSAVDNKDHYTRRHSAQVAQHALALARSLRLDEETQATLEVAALLHDVGKIAIPDRILRKPGTLTPEESEAVKHHSLMGGMMISQHLPAREELALAVTSHHERWDGTGYPSGLQHSGIPLLARILSVADVYSAMTTDRPYRAALSVEEAVSELKTGMGTQFDPQLVIAFVGCLARGLAVAPTKGRPVGDTQLQGGGLSVDSAAAQF